MARRRIIERDRKGSIIVLAAFLVVAMLGMVAFSVDVGYLTNARGELQRSADAAALAAAYQLINLSAPGPNYSMTTNIANGRTSAAAYAGLNKVCGSAPSINANTSNASGGDIVIGAISTPTVPGTAMTFGNPNLYNAAQVTVSRAAGGNGEVPLFFGAIFNRTSAAASAQATAAVITNFNGFQMPADGSSLDILPFALDLQTWNAMMQGSGQDQWAWDASSSSVHSGSDGVPEGNLYPQGTGSPGNRGTVDIGSSNNSTADINRQIASGVNASDLSYMGGKIELGGNGTLQLNGDTGISAGVKDNLASIIGKPKIIPIFNNVGGNGNNAQYTIVQFVSVRILQVKLTGSMSGKAVMIQPAGSIAKGGIPSTTNTQTSAGIFSLPFLVR